MKNVHILPMFKLGLNLTGTLVNPYLAESL